MASTWRVAVLSKTTALFGAFLVMLPACFHKLDRRGTRVVVAVWSDLAVPSELDSIRIDVTGPTGNSSDIFHLSASDEPGKSSLPVQLSLVPLGAEDAIFTVSAVGLYGQSEVVSQTARVSFVGEEALLLKQFLGRACVGIVCSGDTTCSAGACDQPIAVPVLPPYNPNEPLVGPHTNTARDSGLAADGLASSDDAPTLGVREASGSAPDSGAFDTDIADSAEELCIGLTSCDHNCVDINNDPENCGGCGHRCQFHNAQAFCSMGKCQLGPCLPGFGNPAGASANGCECVITNGGVEVCDGMDNNCDGLIDFTLVNGIPNATCRCEQQVLTVASGTPQCGQLTSCAVPQCPIDSAGQEMGLIYSTAACADPYPWAQCRFDSVNMNVFDADHGGTGILEILLCIGGLQSGQKMNSIGIYYGSYPGRKRLSFFTQQELDQGVPVGCYTRHFRPSNVDCPPEPGLPSACLSGCTGGRWGASNHVECIQNYDGVPIWVTAEGCQGTPVDATVRNVTLRLLSGSSCECGGDSDCRDLTRPHCNLSSGVCVPL